MNEKSNQEFNQRMEMSDPSWEEMMNHQNSNKMSSMFDTGDGMIPFDQSMDVMNQEMDVQTLTAYKQRLRELPEVQALTSEIEVQNPNSIIMFGQQASECISQISDELLSSMRSVK